MERSVMRRTKPILAALLMVLFTGYYAGITLFPHVHREGGHTIVHSHPFSGTADNPHHSHNTVQLHLIGHLSLLLLLVSILSGLLKVCRNRAVFSGAVYVPFYRGMSVSSHGLRAPPCC